MIYKIISKLSKIIFRGRIVGKPLANFEKKIFFEKAQHLTFLFQPKIKYEQNIQEKIFKHIKKGNVIFDIGSNIGQYALPFSELVGDEGSVFAFEPDFKNFAFLQFNSNYNRCNNLSCLNYGVGSNDTELEFFRDTETGGRRGSFKQEYVGKDYKGYSNKVILRSFDTLIKDFGEPDIVKIDVEGFEMEVLKGLSAPPTGCVFLIETREKTKVDIFNYFANNGYSCYWIDEANQHINSAEEIPSFANLIFKK